MVGRQKRQTLADFTAEKILARMKQSEVVAAICIGTNHEDSLVARDFAAKYTAINYAYGVHPEEVGTWRGADCLAEVFGEKINLPVAIGEVGLDYHSEGYDRKGQIGLFEEMIDLALREDLPMIFHVREAFEDFFAVLGNFHGVRGVVHSFSDSMENMEKSLARGFYIGVNGLATFADLPMAPIERVLLETDSPFLAPVPFRGRVNEPAHILDIAKWAAEKYQLELEEVAEMTTRNAKELFRLKKWEVPQ